MSLWGAFGFWILVSLSITILVPLFATAVWYLYTHFTPAGRARDAWWERELARLGKQKSVA